MRRWVGGSTFLVALVAAVALPALSHDSVPSSATPAEITRLSAEYVVAPDGDLSVRQILTVRFPGKREYRFYDPIDRNDPLDPRIRRDVVGLQVTIDGHGIGHYTAPASYARYVVLKISRAMHSLSGTHTFVVTYRMHRVLTPGSSTRTRFAWNVVPGTLAEQVDALDVAVHLPAQARLAACTVAPARDGSPCRVSGRGTSVVRVTAGRLPPYAVVSLDAGLDSPTPPQSASLPWSTRLLPVLGPSHTGVVVVLVLALLAGLLGRFLARGAYEPPLPSIASDEPPDGVGPAAAAYLLRERIDHRAFVATLFWGAQKGLVRLDQADGRWRITPASLGETGDRADRGAEDDVAVALTAFLGGPRGSFTARRGDSSAYDDLRPRLAALEDAVRDWCVRAGYLRRTGPGRGGAALLIGLSCFAAFLAALLTLAGRSVSGLVPAAFALTALPLLRPGASVRRTRRGREAAARLVGLRRSVSSPLAAGVGAVSADDLYLAFLPWAVMLGCLDPWTRRFRPGAGIRPPVPDYLGGRRVAPVAEAGRTEPGPSDSGHADVEDVEDVEAVVLDFSRALGERRRQRRGGDPSA